MGDRLSHAMHEINVSLQFFGNSAGTNATKTRLMCQRETGTALLEAAGLHYFRDNGVANLTELNKTEFEARYGLEITLGYMDSGAENVDVIETVNVMGTGLGGVNPLDIATN